MPIFQLKLQDTYWSNGFFNVTVDYQGFVTMDEGAFDVYLGDARDPAVGRVSRSANQNATPRIYGHKELAAFFQAKYKPGDIVPVEIISPTAVRVGGG